MIDPQSGQLGASACGLKAMGVSGCPACGVKPIVWCCGTARTAGATAGAAEPAAEVRSPAWAARRAARAPTAIFWLGAQELRPHEAEDVVDQRLGDRDLRVLGEPGRLEAARG
jgi:hypothetical protein